MPPASASPGFLAVERDNSQATVRKYLPDGTRDLAYAGSGEAVLPVGRTAYLPRPILDASGNLVIAGTSLDMSGHHPFTLARLDASGLPDGSFGSAGIVTTSFTGGLYDYVSALILQPDGRIVAAGGSQTLTALRGAIARYLADGSLDASFGSGGEVLLPNVEVVGLARQADGKIVAATSGFGADGHIVFGLTRLAADGSLDAGFGSGGTAVVPFLPQPFAQPVSQDVRAMRVLVQSDGKILAIGTGTSLFYDQSINRVRVLVARFLADGSLDTGYGTAGLALLPGDGTGVSALEAGDTLLLAVAQTSSFALPQGALYRLRADGVREAGFGSCGTTDVTTGIIDLALEGDGKILALAVVLGVTPGWTISRIESGAADVSGAPDADGDGTPDACDVCPAVADPMQFDRDGDGHGDACDLCSNLGERTPRKGATLQVAKLGSPAGDETLALKGKALIPTTPAIDPVATGVRVALAQANGLDDDQILYDVTIPGGAYDSMTKSGWKSNSKHTAFNYANPAGVLGITNVAIKIAGKAPALTTVTVKGKNLSMPPGYPNIIVNQTVFVQVHPGAVGECIYWNILDCLDFSTPEKLNCKKLF